MSPSAVRSLLFSYLDRRLSDSETRRIEAALLLVGDGDRAVLDQAYAGGSRESVDWIAERAAIDKLGAALEVLSPPRRATA